MKYSHEKREFPAYLLPGLTACAAAVGLWLYAADFAGKAGKKYEMLIPGSPMRLETRQAEAGAGTAESLADKVVSLVNFIR